MTLILPSFKKKKQNKEKGKTSQEGSETNVMDASSWVSSSSLFFCIQNTFEGDYSVGEKNNMNWLDLTAFEFKFSFIFGDLLCYIRCGIYSLV